MCARISSDEADGTAQSGTATVAMAREKLVWTGALPLPRWLPWLGGVAIVLACVAGVVAAAEYVVAQRADRVLGQSAGATADAALVAQWRGAARAVEQFGRAAQVAGLAASAAAVLFALAVPVMLVVAVARRVWRAVRFVERYGPPIPVVAAR
jgi:hypothetical protein